MTLPLFYTYLALDVTTDQQIRKGLDRTEAGQYRTTPLLSRHVLYNARRSPTRVSIVGP